MKEILEPRRAFFRDLGIGAAAFALLSNGCDLYSHDGDNTPSGFDLADYPDMFTDYSNFNGRIVVGSTAIASDVIAAVDIAQGLYLQGIEPGATVLDTELSDLEQNLIIIGRPDSNPLVSNYTLPSLNPGEGLLKIVNHNDYAHLIVSGYDPESTRVAAKVLANHQDYALSGPEAITIGDLANPMLK